MAGYNSSELHDKKYITLDQMIAYNDWEINFSYDPIQNQSADVQYVHKLVNMSKEEVDKQRILPQGPEGAPAEDQHDLADGRGLVVAGLAELAQHR